MSWSMVIRPREYTRQDRGGKKRLGTGYWKRMRVMNNENPFSLCAIHYISSSLQRTMHCDTPSALHYPLLIVLTRSFSHRGSLVYFWCSRKLVSCVWWLSSGRLRVEFFFEIYAEFVTEWFKVFDVFFVLMLVFDFGFDP